MDSQLQQFVSFGEYGFNEPFSPQESCSTEFGTIPPNAGSWMASNNYYSFTGDLDTSELSVPSSATFPAHPYYGPLSGHEVQMSYAPDNYFSMEDQSAVQNNPVAETVIQPEMPGSGPTFMTLSSYYNSNDNDNPQDTCDSFQCFTQSCYQQHPVTASDHDPFVEFASLPMQTSSHPITVNSNERPHKQDPQFVTLDSSHHSIVQNDAHSERLSFSAKAPHATKVEVSTTPTPSSLTSIGPSVDVTATGPDGNKGTFKLVAVTPQDGRRRCGRQGQLAALESKSSIVTRFGAKLRAKAVVQSTTSTPASKTRRRSALLTQHTVKYLMQVVKDRKNHQQVVALEDQDAEEKFYPQSEPNASVQRTSQICPSMRFTDPNLENSMSESTGVHSIETSQASNEPEINMAYCQAFSTSESTLKTEDPVSRLSVETGWSNGPLESFSWGDAGTTCVESAHLTVSNQKNLMTTEQEIKKLSIDQTHSKRRNRCYDFESLRIGYFRVPSNVGRNKLRFYFISGCLVYDFQYSYSLPDDRRVSPSSSTIPLEIAVIVPFASIIGIEFRSKKIAIFVDKPPRLVSGLNTGCLNGQPGQDYDLTQYEVDVTDGQLSSPFHFITLPRAQGSLIQKHFLSVCPEYASMRIDTSIYPYAADFLQDDNGSSNTVGSYMNQTKNTQVVCVASEPTTGSQSRRIEKASTRSRSNRQPEQPNAMKQWQQTVSGGLQSHHRSSLASTPSASTAVAQHCYNTRSHASFPQNVHGFKDDVASSAVCVVAQTSDRNFDELDVALRSIVS